MRRLDVEGRFFEAPRWRDGRWWVSDMTDRVVRSLAADGTDVRVEVVLEDRPSGLGWLPDGTLLVVGMDTRTLLAVRPDGSSRLYADLAPSCGDLAGHLNDMVVTPEGHAYVGFDPDFAAYGFRCDGGAILHVDPSGGLVGASAGLHFPNGMVITADRATLIVAETGTPRLTCFAIGEGGMLADRRVWADVGAGHDERPYRAPPLALSNLGLDGCAIDRAGRIWVADANGSTCLQVAESGAVRSAITLPAEYRCLACALGGDEGSLLLLCGLALSSDQVLETSRSHLFLHRIGDARGI